MHNLLKILVFSVLCGAVLATFPASAQKGPPRGPQQVIVYDVKKMPIDDRVEALGTLRANETVALTASVTEQVTDVNFEDGQRVKEGNILVEMTSAQEKAELDAGQATVDEALKQYERIKSLSESGASSLATLDQRRRDYETAKAKLDEISSRISDRIITAPFEGVLGLREISKGTVLQPGMKITTIDDDSVMKLDFNVPAVFLSALRVGLDIEAKSNAFPDHVFKGKVSAIDSQVDATTRSIIVRAVLPNEEKLLRPGLLMRVEVVKSPREAIVIPEEAIIPVGHDNHVFIVAEGDEGLAARKQPVVLGTRKPGFVEILEGLEQGMRIVTHGTMNVTDGGPVAIRGVQGNGQSVDDIIRATEQKEVVPEGQGKP